MTANVSNTIGLVPGSLSGAVGYRRELAGQRRRAVRLGTASMLGGATGAVLLLVLPAAAFKAIVPAFIAIALVLVVLQPRLNRLAGQAPGRLAATRAASSRRSPSTRPGSTAATSAPPRGSCCSGSSASRCRRTCTAPTRSRTSSPALANGVAGALLRAGRARGLGTGRDHRRRLDRRRPARRALRAPTLPRHAAGAHRGGRRHRDRAPPGRMRQRLGV